jgi:hypothetical protein
VHHGTLTSLMCHVCKRRTYLSHVCTVQRPGVPVSGPTLGPHGEYWRCPLGRLTFFWSLLPCYGLRAYNVTQSICHFTLLLPVRLVRYCTFSFTSVPFSCDLVSCVFYTCLLALLPFRVPVPRSISVISGKEMENRDRGQAAACGQPCRPPRVPPHIHTHTTPRQLSMVAAVSLRSPVALQCGCALARGACI